MWVETRVGREHGDRVMTADQEEGNHCCVKGWCKSEGGGVDRGKILFRVSDMSQVCPDKYINFNKSSGSGSKMEALAIKPKKERGALEDRAAGAA